MKITHSGRSRAQKVINPPGATRKMNLGDALSGSQADWLVAADKPGLSETRDEPTVPNPRPPRLVTERMQPDTPCSL